MYSSGIKERKRIFFSVIMNKRNSSFLFFLPPLPLLFDPQPCCYTGSLFLYLQ